MTIAEWKENLIQNEKYLDKIDFVPYLDKYDDFDDLRDAVREDYDYTEFTNNDFLNNNIFCHINRGCFADYLEERYGEDYFIYEEPSYDPPIYIRKKKMINKEELINYLKELAESYENAELPSWIDFQTLIEHIEFFEEH